MHDSFAHGHIRSMLRTSFRSIRLLLLAVVALILLSGCSIGGGGDEPTPTLAPATQPSGAQANGDQSVATAPRIAGDLADRIGVAWQGVTSFRATTRQGTGDIASIPLPQPPVSGAIPPETVWHRSAGHRR